MGAARLEVLDPETNNWEQLDMRPNSEPGPCFWTGWRGVDRVPKSRFFRFGLFDNNCGAYHAFASLELDILSTDYYELAIFENTVREVTYSASILEQNATKKYFQPDGGNLRNDECECTSIYSPSRASGQGAGQEIYTATACGVSDGQCCPGYSGVMALHGNDGSNAYGQNWATIELKAPTHLQGFRLKSRNHPNAPVYLGSVDLLGSNDGVTWTSVLDSSQVYNPQACRMGPYVPANPQQRTKFKYFKLEIFGNDARGYESFSQLVMYADPLSVGLEVGLVQYFPLERSLTSVVGSKAPLDVSATTQGKPTSGCNDWRSHADGTWYSHRLEPAERVGDFSRCDIQDGTI